MRHKSWSYLALATVFALACSSTEPDDSNIVRGHRLAPVTLPVTTEAAIVDASIRAAFDVDPSLVLMAHPRRLPRTAGYEGGDSVSSALLGALRERGLIRGECDPRHDAPHDTPRCPGASAGYVIRVSQPFQAVADTVQVNFAAEKFAAASGLKPEALRFEKI
jgi:hypothetical protein